MDYEGCVYGVIWHCLFTLAFLNILQMFNQILSKGFNILSIGTVIFFRDIEGGNANIVQVSWQA